MAMRKLTFVDVGRVGLLPGFARFLLVARWSGRLFAGFFLLGRGSLARWGLATSGGLFLSSFRRHIDGLKVEDS